MQKYFVVNTKIEENNLFMFPDKKSVLEFIREMNKKHGCKVSDFKVIEGNLLKKGDIKC